MKSKKKPAQKKVKRTSAKKTSSPKPKRKPARRSKSSSGKSAKASRHQLKPVAKVIAAHPSKSRKPDTRTRYSDRELEEFRQLILEKLDVARKELSYMQEQIKRTGDNGTDDTENKFASMDDGSGTMEREYLNQMAARQRLYIDHLDKALIRIQNKTYGICRVTGKLIDKDRLRSVPHATLSMEAKLMQHNNPNIQ